MAKKDKKQAKLDDPYYQGECTSKHLSKGPTNDRRCTDFFCLIIFLGFWFGTVSIAGYALSKGDPIAFTRPYDQFGNQCGVNNTISAVDLREYPYLFFVPDGEDFAPNITRCVSTCPDDAIIGLPKSYDDASEIKGYPTYTFADRFCVPSSNDTRTMWANTTSLDSSVLFDAATDLKTSWWMILVVGAFTLVLGFLYLIFMKYFAGALIWGVLVAFILATAGFGLWCLEEALGNISSEGELGELDPTYLKVLAGVSFFISLVAFVITCVCRTRINLSIAVLKCATDFIEDTKTILIVPFVFFVKSMLFYVGWAVIFLYIIGTNTTKADEDNYPIGDIEWNTKSFGMMAYYIFGLFWSHTFCVALSQFIIASSACFWYFKQGRSMVDKSPVWISVKRSILHVGSIAFGSLLVALLDVLRIVFKYLNSKLNNAPAEEGGPTGFCAACCSCCLGFFEKFLKFVNRHAYIQMAMTGESFCTATEEAFHLLARNAVRFGMVHGIANIFLFFGQLLVAFTATMLGYLIITRVDYFEDALMSPFVPSVMFFLSSYMVAHLFMSIYSVSADTVIHCFAMDEEMHDGHAEYAPKELREFVDETCHRRVIKDYSLLGSAQERLL